MRGLVEEGAQNCFCPGEFRTVGNAMDVGDAERDMEVDSQQRIGTI